MAADTIAPAATGVTAFVGRAPQDMAGSQGAPGSTEVAGPGVPVEITSLAEAERLLGTVQAENALLSSLRDFFMNGGERAIVSAVRGAEGTTLGAADYIGDRTARTGFYALDAVDAFDLLVIAPDAGGADLPAGVLAAAAAYSAERRAFLVCNPLVSWEDAARSARFDAIDPAVLGIPQVVADHAAVYFPRLRRTTGSNADNGSSAAPAGAVAGCIARTDRTRGVWAAPAGSEAALMGTAGPSIVLDDRAVQRITLAGVNVLRTLPGGSAVIWGARTLRGDDKDPYRYVPVRRFALYVETSISRGLQWAQFEPNEEALWARVRAAVTEFLMTTGVAHQWPRPELGFFVKCDRTTMTQDDVDNGRLVVDVGVAPIKAAEFLIIRIGGWARKPPA